MITAVVMLLISLTLVAVPAVRASVSQQQPQQPATSYASSSGSKPGWLRDLFSIPRQDPPLVEDSTLQITASSAIAVDITTNQLLYQDRADEPVSPASTLKIVTALTALTVLDLDEQVEVEAIDLVDTAVYSNAALMEGDLVRVRDLLAGLLIPSGGDAANTLARVAGQRLGTAEGQDPIDRFVTEMNRVADEIGMRNSNFVNPDGRDVPDQYTTARDLALAARDLLRSPVLSDIVSRTDYEMTVEGPNARSYEIHNTNQLLGAELVHGVKTGTTDSAGESIVLATRRGGNQVLTVVMGSDQRYVDTQALLDQIDEQVTWVSFSASPQFPGVQSASRRFEFVIATPVVVPMRSEDAGRLHATVNLGPRPRGEMTVIWGDVVFLLDGEMVYRLPVMSAG